MPDDFQVGEATPAPDGTTSPAPEAAAPEAASPEKGKPAKKAAAKKAPAKKAATKAAAKKTAGKKAASASAPVDEALPIEGVEPTAEDATEAAAPAKKVAKKAAAKKATTKKTAASKLPETEPEALVEAGSEDADDTAAAAAAPAVLFQAPEPTVTTRTRKRAPAKKAVSEPASETGEPAAEGDDAAPTTTPVRTRQPRATAASRAADATGGDDDIDASDDEAEADETADGEGAEGGAPRRRRRRGGRRRRKPGEGGSDAADGSEGAEDDGDEAEAGAPSKQSGSDDPWDDFEDGDGAAQQPRAQGQRSRGQAAQGAGQGAGQGGGKAQGAGAKGQGGAKASTGPDDAEDADQRDGADDGGDGSSRRRRRRRRAGDDGGEGGDDPENTVTRVRSARSAEDQITSISGSTRLEAKKQRRREGRDAGRRRAPIVSEAEFLARREAVDRVMVVRQRDDLTQIAVIEDKVLVEHYVARESQTSIIGNVYLGRVQNVLPSMEAAFIDIGKGRNAVLYAGEVNWAALGHKEGQPRKIESVLSSGQPVLVQVTKDPIGHKGARLSSQVSLAGRFLVYVPDGTTSGISRKLPDTERNRLKTLLKEIVPDTAGVIVRTAAEGASEDELTRDVERLKARWEDIEAKIKGNAPQLLYGEPDLTLKVVRDLFTEDFAKLVIEGDDAWETVKDYVSHIAPDLEERLERYEPQNGKDVFAAYRVDEQIAKGLDRKVWLPSGGSLVIDRTEAMTVVDVNTGKFTGSGGNLEETVTKNNLEAAEEIVRQLRLRDIGGIIVVDFIDMVLESNRDLVLRRLVECLGRDRTRHQVAEVTSLGLVQMTRKRIGTGLLEAFSDNCEHCQGRGIVTHDHPVEPKRGEDDSRRGGGSGGGSGSAGGSGTSGRRSRGGRGRGQGDDADQGSRSGAPSGAPSPKVVAAMTRHEPSDQPSDGPVEAAAEAVTPDETPLATSVEAAYDAPDSTDTTADTTPDTMAVAEPEPEPEPEVAQAPEQPEPVAATTAVVTRTRRRSASRPAGQPAGTEAVAGVVETSPAPEAEAASEPEPEAASSEASAKGVETAEVAPAPPTVITRTRGRSATRPAGPPAQAPDAGSEAADAPSHDEHGTVEHVPIKKKGTRKR